RLLSIEVYHTRCLGCGWNYRGPKTSAEAVRHSTDPSGPDWPLAHPQEKHRCSSPGRIGARL
ncbi:hypothetical protein FRC06_010242, partial [Ceratobasidium sp. 370]